MGGLRVQISGRLDPAKQARRLIEAVRRRDALLFGLGYMGAISARASPGHLASTVDQERVGSSCSTLAWTMR